MTQTTTPGQMQKPLTLASVPMYEAFGAHGSFMRPAQTIDELPQALKTSALEQAQRRLSVVIHYGTTIASSNNMRPSEVKADSRSWLNCKGCDLPLTLFMD